MKTLKLFTTFLFLLIFTSHFSNAAVWHSENTWDDSWDQKYRSWILSSEYNTRIFKTPGTVLYRLSTDCADHLYAIRIYFAWKNSLPFVIKAPDSYHMEGGILSNESPMFDEHESETQRVRALMHYVSMQTGTSSLADDTYPLKISEITAGDIYFTKWRFLWKTAHHSMVVKRIYPDGNGIFYWSDAPRAIQTLEVTKGVPQFKFKSKPYGYRRWRRPEHIGVPLAEIPAELGYSNEQYELLYRVGSGEILEAIRDRMRR